MHAVTKSAYLILKLIVVISELFVAYITVYIYIDGALVWLTSMGLVQALPNKLI